jgi:hypothetical protein
MSRLQISQALRVSTDVTSIALKLSGTRDLDVRLTNAYMCGDLLILIYEFRNRGNTVKDIYILVVNMSFGMVIASYHIPHHFVSEQLKINGLCNIIFPTPMSFISDNKIVLYYIGEEHQILKLLVYYIDLLSGKESVNVVDIREWLGENKKDEFGYLTPTVKLPTSGYYDSISHKSVELPLCDNYGQVSRIIHPDGDQILSECFWVRTFVFDPDNLNNMQTFDYDIRSVSTMNMIAYSVNKSYPWIFLIDTMKQLLTRGRNFTIHRAPIFLTPINLKGEYFCVQLPSVWVSSVGNDAAVVFGDVNYGYSENGNLVITLPGLNYYSSPFLLGSKDFNDIILVINKDKGTCDCYLTSSYSFLNGIKKFDCGVRVNIDNYPYMLLVSTHVNDYYRLRRHAWTVGNDFGVSCQGLVSLNTGQVFSCRENPSISLPAISGTTHSQGELTYITECDIPEHFVVIRGNFERTEKNHLILESDIFLINVLPGIYTEEYNNKYTANSSQDQIIVENRKFITHDFT